MTDAAPARDPRAVLAEHGRSFHHAARLLGEERTLRAARLYAWCRAVDDLADEAPPTAAGTAAAETRLLGLRSALEHGDGEDPLAAELLSWCAELGADPRHGVELVDGVLGDLGEVALPDERALVRYGHAVAGTVGLLMLPALGVTDPEAAPFAVDLGIAMQLTNVSRDVVADAAIGRRYLPGTWLADLPPERILAPTPDEREQVRAAVARTLELAEAYYDSAEAGLAHLPGRPRAAIRVAARVYRRIGRRLARQHHDVWAGRTVVPSSVKGAVTVGALGRHLTARVPGSHDARLHRHLDGLSGAAVLGSDAVMAADPRTGR